MHFRESVCGAKIKMDPLMGNIIVTVFAVGLTPFLFSKALRLSNMWKATVTPLASIIGSGFLVSTPLLVLTVGIWAPVAMLIIVITAYFLGSVMRFNISHLEDYLHQESAHSGIKKLEFISRPTLGIAYMISVAFYLKLLSVFALKGVSIDSAIAENILTTAILSFIGFIGWRRSLGMLELFEKYAVNSKLVVIFSLIVGFMFYNAQEALRGSWELTNGGNGDHFETFRKLLGILIIVQGFETSRYISELYPKLIRIKSMKIAQILSGVIYVLFVGLSMVLFKEVTGISETVVIDLCKVIAPILPFLLVFAAVMSQFSAAVADTIGGSGLISEASNNKISSQHGVLITILVAIALIWITNIYEIVVIASKAFAIYYGIQCVIAAKLAGLKKYKGKAFAFYLLSFLMLCVVILGIPAE